MLKETLRAKTAKIKLVRKRQLFIATIFVLTLIIISLFLLPKHAVAPVVSCGQPYRADIKAARLTIQKNETFDIEVASSEQAHEKGLSDRSCIGANQAMLFEFTEPGNYGFWMKDMQFDIDIVWLDDSKTITHIEQNLTAVSYPKVFYPNALSRFVIELRGGTASLLDLRMGEKLQW